MAQLFKPSSNSIAKMSIMGGGALVVLIFGAGMTITRGSMNTRVGVAVDQPVSFSHQHHATELGIDCRYCHTSVEVSARAGMPQTETCMTCHSQIWTNSPLLEPIRESYANNKAIKWVQLNKLPEFAYFNHSIHVNKGVSCNNCHGGIQSMQMAYKGQTLTMAWCLECHKSPEEYMWEDPKRPDLSPREQVFNLYKKYQVDPSMKNDTYEERSLAHFGSSQKRFQKSGGEELMKKRGIRKAQLIDCWVCHR